MIITIPKVCYPPIMWSQGPRIAGELSLNAANDQVAHVFTWEHDDATINTVAFKIKVASGSSTNTLAIEIWSVDETTAPNEPSAILAAGNTVDQNVAGTDDNTVFEVTLGTGADLVRGTKYAIVVRMKTFVGDFCTLPVGDNYFWPVARTPYSMMDIAGGASWSVDVDDFMLFALGDDKGVYRPIGNTLPPGSTTLGEQNVNTSASADEIGNIIQVPAPMRTCGAWITGDFDGDLTIKLYSNPLTNPTLLASSSWDAGYRPSTSDNANADLQWDTSLLMTANTDYALTVLAGSASSGLMPIGNCHTEAMLGAYLPGSTSWRYCERDGSSGAFSETNTKRCLGIGLVIDGVDDGRPGPRTRPMRSNVA